MRSREEQIEDMCKWATDLVHPHRSDARMAELYILEAERRAEQRVREAIARDSERLDWLEQNCAGAKSQWNDAQSIVEWKVVDGKWHQSLRTAIDAAREAQG